MARRSRDGLTGDKIPDQEELPIEQAVAAQLIGLAYPSEPVPMMLERQVVGLRGGPVDLGQHRVRDLSR